MSDDRETVVKEVAYFYWLQSNYSFIDDDLNYADFNGDYWTFLKDGHQEPAELHWGCLAIIFAMAMHEASGVGVVWGGRLSLCVDALGRYSPKDEASEEILRIVLRALELVSVDQYSRDWKKVEELAIDARLVHMLSVRAYYNKMASRWA